MNKYSCGNSKENGQTTHQIQNQVKEDGKWVKLSIIKNHRHTLFRNSETVLYPDMKQLRKRRNLPIRFVFVSRSCC